MRLFRTVPAILASLSLLAPSVVAQTSDTMLILVPHCAETDRSLCEQFDVVDATHLATKKLAVGDLLDIDVVLSTAAPSAVQTIRAWLHYDPTVLEARSIDLLPGLPSPFPGERDIEKSLGLVKIGGSTDGKVTGADTALARVTFRVLVADRNTEIVFSGYQSNGVGQTYVNGKTTPSDGNDNGLLPAAPCFDDILGCKDKLTPLLSAEPSKLTITLGDGGSVVPTANAQTIASSSSFVSSSAVSTTSGNPTAVPPGPSSAPANSTFPLLQVQNVQVTTRNQDIFLGWQALRSAELKGYNVYYGTVSGRYIQRKSIPGSATSLVLHDLEPGITYFLAIRAFNVADVESAFSREVSISVGKPETSSAPLATIVSDVTAPEGNPLQNQGGKVISGETGTGDTILVLMLLSAVIGTAFAFHRHIILSRHVA